MKQKHKLEYLNARIKAWEQRHGKNEESGHLHMKPGSEKK